MHRWRTGVLIRRAARVVALWPDAAEAIQRLYSVDADRISVIPNARSSDEFRPPTDVETLKARASLGLPMDARIVGCVGSIAAEKRLHLAVDAVAGLEHVHLLVVGDGPERADVEQHAQDVLGERATFAGTLDDVVPAYRAIDVLLVTSRTEGMPGVVLEASMSGVPVVATQVGALSDMFAAGIPGALVPLESDATSIGAVVRAVLVERPRSPTSPAGDFGWPAVTSRWIEQLEDEVRIPSESRVGATS